MPTRPTNDFKGLASDRRALWLSLAMATRAIGCSATGLDGNRRYVKTRCFLPAGKQLSETDKRSKPGYNKAMESKAIYGGAKSSGWCSAYALRRQDPF